MSRQLREDIDRLYDYDIHIPTRTVYIGSVEVNLDGDESGVDAIMAERAIKALHILDRTEGEITIILNNPGGDWYHGMAIYDAIKQCNNHVTIKVYGMAMSMGAVILQAADKRILTPNSKVMIHHGYMGMPGNHTKIYEKWADESKRVRKEMIDILLDKIKQKHPKSNEKQLDKMLDFDHIMSAQEAVDLGLADEIG